MMDHQLEHFYTTPTGSAWTVDPMGFLVELNDRGKKAMRKAWEDPNKRSLFGEEPPEEWSQL